MNIKTFHVDGNNRIVVNGVKIMWATLSDIMPYGDDNTSLQDKFELFVIDMKNGNTPKKKETTPKKKETNKVDKNETNIKVKNNKAVVPKEKLLDYLSDEIEELTQFYYNQYKDIACIEIDDIRSELIIVLYETYEKLLGSKTKLTYNNKKTFIYIVKNRFNYKIDKSLGNYVYGISTPDEQSRESFELVDINDKLLEYQYTIDDITSLEMKRSINRALNNLRKQERVVLELRFGLNYVYPITLKKAGEKLRLSKARIGQIEKIALRKMRHPNNAKLLYDFLYD